MTDTDKRISEFIIFKGGDSAVAKATGKKPQLFQAVRVGRGKAGREIIDALLNTYEDFDETYIFRGIKTQDINYAKPINSEVVIDELKNQLKNLTQEKEQIESRLQKVELEKDVLFKVLEKITGSK